MQWQTNVVKFCKVCASAWNLGPLCYVRCYISSSACTSYAYTSRPNQWSALQLALHMRMCPDQTNGQLFCLHFICICVQTKPMVSSSASTSYVYVSRPNQWSALLPALQTQSAFPPFLSFLIAQVAGTSSTTSQRVKVHGTTHCCPYWAQVRIQTTCMQLYTTSFQLLWYFKPEKKLLLRFTSRRSWLNHAWFNVVLMRCSCF